MKILTRATHWFPVVYMRYTNRNCLLFLVTNLSVLNFRIFLAHVSGATVAEGWGSGAGFGVTHLVFTWMTF